MSVLALQPTARESVKIEVNFPLDTEDIPESIKIKKIKDIKFRGNYKSLFQNFSFFFLFTNDSKEVLRL